MSVISNVTTPKKYIKRTQDHICRLCVKKTDRFCKVFSVPGIKKKLAEKIFKTTSIVVEESDQISLDICRKCEGFVDKISDFQKICKDSEKDLKKYFSIKREEKDSPSTSSDRTKKKIITNAMSRKQLQFGPLQNITNKSYINKSDNVNTTSVSLDTSRIIKTFLTNKQEVLLNNAFRTRTPSIIAHTIFNEIPSVNTELKRLIAEQLYDTSKSLKKRKNGSVLISGSYEELVNFNISKVWDELVKAHPYFIDVMNSIAGNLTDIVNTEAGIKTKYCFIYSILMNIHWRELSLWQRINTTMAIEGGCSKKVNIVYIHMYYIYYLQLLT